MPNSYKVAFYVGDDPEPRFNEPRFKTKEEAKKYAATLAEHWKAMNRYEVVGDDEEPNWRVQAMSMDLTHESDEENQ